MTKTPYDLTVMLDVLVEEKEPYMGTRQYIDSLEPDAAVLARMDVEFLEAYNVISLKCARFVVL